MEKLTAFWHAAQPFLAWLVVFGIPSIINGLLKYPDPRAAKVVAWLSRILDVISALARSDSPGTFKPLFTRSQPPAVVGSTITITESVSK